MIFVTKNSNKSQKTMFWKEKSTKNVVTLEGLLFNSNMKNWHVGDIKFYMIFVTTNSNNFLKNQVLKGKIN